LTVPTEQPQPLEYATTKRPAAPRVRWWLRLLILALPILTFFAYQPINEGVIVKKFGCGCNPAFNANDFNGILWASLAVVWISLWCVASLRGFPKGAWPSRIAAVGAGSLWLAVSSFVTLGLMMWG
jgi:hypothetical protein